MSEVTYDHLTTTQIRALCLSQGLTITPGDKRQRSTWVATLRSAPKVVTALVANEPTSAINNVETDSTKQVAQPLLSTQADISTVSAVTIPSNRVTSLPSPLQSIAQPEGNLPSAIPSIQPVTTRVPIPANVIGMGLILMINAVIALAFFLFNFSYQICNRVWQYVNRLVNPNLNDHQLIFNKAANQWNYSEHLETRSTPTLQIPFHSKLSAKQS